MTFWKKTTENDRDRRIMHSIMMALCIFIVSQFKTLLLLNQSIIPLGGEWASTCKEWVINVLNYENY